MVDTGDSARESHPADRRTVVDLELRKQALEATGWRCLSNSRKADSVWTGTPPESWFRWSPAEVMEIENGFISEEIALKCAPAVESEAGISEPWFLEWCEKHKMWFRLVNIGDFGKQEYEICLYRDALDAKPFVLAEGATPSEARARAVVTAMSQRGGR